MKRTVLIVLSALCESLAACSGVSGFSRSLATPSGAFAAASRPRSFPRRGPGIRPFPAGRRGPALAGTASSFAVRLAGARADRQRSA